MLGIRTNTKLISPKELKKRLEEKGFELKKLDFCDYCFVLKHEPFSISSTTEHLLGYFYIQDPNSMRPPLWLNLKSSDVVLDMCAAPGGKATHIAQFATVIAVDINVARMRALKSNFIRMKLDNYIAYRMNVLNFEGKFDKILLDAPCTGTGVSDRKVTKEEILNFQRIQRKMIDKAYELLNAGGILIYSTCSTTFEENEENLEYASQKFKVKRYKRFPKGEFHGFFLAEMIKND